MMTLLFRRIIILTILIVIAVTAWLFWPQSVQQAERAAPASTQTPEAPEPRALLHPSFDVWWVAPDGEAVIAGRTEAGADVRILIDGTEVTRGPSDSRGEFAFIFTLPPNPAPSLMTIAAHLSDGQVLTSAESVALAPILGPEAPQDAPPPAILLTDNGAVKLPPSSSEPVENAQIKIGAISYDDAGNIQIAGSGATGQTVQPYLDNAPQLAVDIDENGAWAIELPDVAAGVYTLRIDQADAQGKVTSRAETPFKREEPARIEAQKAVQITVQPGASLWRIARANYGSGVLYVQVFAANSDQIKDPDLIYPGQLLRLPTQ